ncbi:MAG TPA: FIST N-terminal domain-containing protein [Aromatoleum sp.]|uniref:FIST signal transduction protein n=1 Tax=Aromatoleum sp. TaxID=2307007 RepID=UPI002B471A5A|nr:FIST N-terminal domain-containing protein [Aromatoleum sp.]HJV27987.1 FIST N-terminal domain-containing protein [Aromatoleum sp.]
MSPASFVLAHAANSDWKFALTRARDQLQSQIAERHSRHPDARPFTLGWCYLGDYYADEAEAILSALQAEFPDVSWVGASALGVSATGVEYFDEPALVLMLAPLPRTAFRLFSGLQPLPMHPTDFPAHTALVHAEGSTPDLQELLQELAVRTTTGYLFGGLSSARNRTLHIADHVLSGGLSGVAFGPEVDLISRVTQGCQPIGTIRTITGSEDNYVLRLDGRPALACLLDDLGLDTELPTEEMLEALSGTLVGLSTGTGDVAAGAGQFGPDTLVRHLIGVDPQNQVLAIGDEVTEGMHLAFCTRDAQAARADLVRIALEVRTELAGSGKAIAGALYVSCSGRGGPHFGGPHAELQTVRDVLGDVPLAGFFAAGEIARDHLYGYTGVLTAFAMPE